MHTAPVETPSEPLHRIPDLLGRLPLPAEAWARFEQRLPDPLRAGFARLGVMRRSLPPMPHLTGRQIFAAALPAGLMIGWLTSLAVNPEIMQRGGKPYAEVATDGVQVQLPKLAWEYDAYPEDPAPFGYRDPAQQQLFEGGIADAGQYADTAGPDAAAAPTVSDGQVLGEQAAEPAPQQPRFTSQPVIEVVPQDTPL